MCSAEFSLLPYPPPHRPLLYTNMAANLLDRETATAEVG